MEQPDSITMDAPVKLPLWKNLAEVAKEWDYWSEHTHEEIESILDIPRLIDKVYSNEEYYDAISNANAYLTDIGKRLENIFGIGYRVLNPNDYPQHASIPTIWNACAELLLMHSAAGINPMNPLTKEMKSLTSKRKKTDEDHLRILEISYEMALYLR